jgi:UDP-N-acetylglucosamine 2-epimerase (non-hydrolysing)
MSLKIMTVLGTRPEIIRLSRIIPKLDALTDHVLVHTGQNFDENLSDIFFNQLGVRAPDYYLGVTGANFAEIVGRILIESERIIHQVMPDALLILGDTNSGLAAVIAKRMGIPVYHMEAGNRCYDDRVPEEVNRRIIDHSSDVLMPYTERSRANLLREGIEGRRIYVTGNPIKEVLDHYAPQIDASDVFDKLKLDRGGYFLVTLHRAENVDIPARLGQFIDALHQLHEVYGSRVVCSVHPRTRSQLAKQGKTLECEGILALEPLGFFDFVALEKHARCVLSDSGTVQEECCIFGVPNVTLRDVTERPETVEVGSNILSGADTEDILRCVRVVLDGAPHWSPPPEYLVPGVSRTVMKILMVYLYKV